MLICNTFCINTGENERRGYTQQRFIDCIIIVFDVDYGQEVDFERDIRPIFEDLPVSDRANLIEWARQGALDELFCPGSGSQNRSLRPRS